MPEIEIKRLKAYNLINPNGDEVQLHLGRLKNPKDFNGDKDTGFRWMFTGKKIPMPVWSGDWFKGHPEATMLNWLKENGGWAVHAIWNVTANKLSFFDLPSAPEDDRDYLLIKEAIRAYYEDQNFCECAKLYRMLTGETCITASMNAIEHILSKPYADPKATATETDWISVSTGRYPEDGKNVRILYQYRNNDEYFCDITACRKNGIWCDADDGIKLNVKITAWRCCEPYKVDDIIKANETETDWIPVSDGNYPDHYMNVQVTYLSHPNRDPKCDAIAYWNGARWSWYDGAEPTVEITAWRPICDPYKAKEA